MRFLLTSLTALFMLASTAAWAEADATAQVKLETSEGDIVLELNLTKAPITTKNFINYVNAGYYNGTIFHRVIKDFVIQGGGFTPEMDLKESNATILNEAKNGLKNKRGTIAMARSFDPHSANAQFYINVKNNLNLDHVDETPRGWGYAVFGRVIKGMNVVDKINNTRTGPNGPLGSDVPLKMMLIHKATVLESKKK